MATQITKTPAQPIVLIVDNSPITRKNIQQTLQPAGIHVITASDGLQALTTMADLKPTPALILLATQLPRMNGYQVCSILRKNLRFRDIPIIMLNEKETPFDKIQNRLAGATDHFTLTIPLNSLVLIETVKKYLRNGPEPLPQQP
jgi:twitching motility two-component system response regulator PilG